MPADKRPTGTGHRLEAWIEGLRPGARLPTDTDLGRQWGASSRTIRRHMKRFEARGLVVRVQGRGTFRAPVQRGNAPEPAPPPASSRDRLTAQLTDAIARGEIKRGDPLPQTKYLKLQYGLSGKTILRAYSRLEQQGLAHRLGRRYYAGRLLPAVHPLQRHDVYLVTPEASDFDRIFDGDLMAPAYVAFERTLRSLGLILEYETRHRLSELVHECAHGDRIAAGVVLWNFDGESYPHIEKLFGPLVTHCPAPRLSLLLDTVTMGPITRAPRHVDIVSRGNIMTTQARAVADFVLQRGRRPAALVYSADSIHERRGRWFLRFQKVAFELFQRTGEIVRSYIVDPHGSLSAEWIVETIAKPEQWFYEYLAEKLAQPRIRSTAFIEESLAIVKDYREVASRSGPEPLLIFPLDDTAREASRCFSESRLEIPGDIWLLTLEGQPRNLPLGLSACAPDWETAGYLMAHAIVGDMPLKRTRRGFLRVPCPVVERLTTG
ncbi:MAG: GntR family transcriptional regulator [Chitinivibrionales bacterium]|nr:GntR family transcriptional regulator [Chitinivibrionales bacterium]